jgi:OOP family OmpA-OmpF porin
MNKKNFIFRIFLLVLITQFHSLISQTEKEYNDGHGKKIKIPLGDRAFADSLISYKPGNPAPLYEKCKNGMLALGPPDFDGVDNNFTVLGSGGEIVLFFKDNALINIPGIDLYVFELGKYIEETYLSISTDGKKWINVGKISGGNAAVDLGDNIPENEIYRFIKLKDFSKLQDKNESYPGADIDAVAAIGSAKAISLNSSVLFNYSDANLKKEAFPSLDSIAEYLNKNPDYLIKVQGHCDSTGNNSFNKQLSINRANAVKKYLVSKTKNKSLNFISEGFSSEIPISSNSTENGRKKNRRVDIFLIPLTQKKK